MNKEAAAMAGQNGIQMSRAKLSVYRIVLLTSLVWVFIDAFLIFYLTDCGTSLASMPNDPNCARCEVKLERLERELNSQRKSFADYLQKSNL